MGIFVFGSKLLPNQQNHLYYVHKCCRNNCFFLYLVQTCSQTNWIVCILCQRVAKSFEIFVFCTICLPNQMNLMYLMPKCVAQQACAVMTDMIVKTEVSNRTADCCLDMLYSRVYSELSKYMFVKDEVVTYFGNKLSLCGHLIISRYTDMYSHRRQNACKMRTFTIGCQSVEMVVICTKNTLTAVARWQRSECRMRLSCLHSLVAPKQRVCSVCHLHMSCDHKHEQRCNVCQSTVRRLREHARSGTDMIAETFGAWHAWWVPVHNASCCQSLALW